MAWNRLQNLGQNGCGYKIIADNGRNDIGEGIMYYMSSKYKEKHKGKTYNFAAYASGSATEDTNSSSTKKSKYGTRKTTINNKGYTETDPIQNMDTKYSFDNKEGEIIIDLKNNKK